MNKLEAWNKFNAFFNRDTAEIKNEDYLCLISNICDEYFDEDKYYLLGLIWYSSTLDESIRRDGIIDNFNKSINEGVRLEFSYKYLAYFHFDIKEYKTVLECYKNIPFDYLETSIYENFWWELEFLDVLIASYIYLNEFDIINKCIDKLYSKWKKQTSLDLPIELNQIRMAMSDYLNTNSFNGKLFTQTLSKLNEMINMIDNDNKDYIDSHN